MRYRGPRNRGIMYQSPRYRGKRRPNLLLVIVGILCAVSVGTLAAGAIYQSQANNQPPDVPDSGQAVIDPLVPVLNTPQAPEPSYSSPAPEPEADPAAVVENTGGFELPVEGTHGIALVNLKLYADHTATRSSGNLLAGTAFTILREGGDRVLVSLRDGSKAWANKNDIMVNLPDLIPSMIYKNSNAEGSLMKNLGMDLEGITGRQLYQSKVYNEKLGRDEFIMPVQYQMAKKIMQAQQLAKERGVTIVLYEGFRPHDVQMAVAGALQRLAGTNPDTRSSIQKNGFNISYYISTGTSSHQMGSAVDVSLAQVNSWEDRSFHGHSVSVPASFTEFSYCGIVTDSADGVRFSSEIRYGPALPEDTAHYMPTPIHELSYLSGTFTGPTKTYVAGAWRTALNSGAVKRAEFWTDGAQTLQDLFVAADLEPLASEWWHFNDLAAWNTANKANAAGKFEVGTQSFSMTPADAAALAGSVQ